MSPNNQQPSATEDRPHSSATSTKGQSEHVISAEEGRAKEGAVDKSSTGLFRSTTVATADGNTLFSKKSYAARLKPVESEGFRRKNNLLRLMGRPFHLLTFPIIFYAGFLYGSNIIWLTVLNATEAMVLSANPYNMSTSIIGLTFIAPLVGTTLAYVSELPPSPDNELTERRLLAAFSLACSATVLWSRWPAGIVASWKQSTASGSWSRP